MPWILLTCKNNINVLASSQTIQIAISHIVLRNQGIAGPSIRLIGNEFAIFNLKTTTAASKVFL